MTGALLAPSLFGFGAVLLRTVALCMTAPLFAEKMIPARVRLALAFAAAIPVFLGADAPRLDGWQRADVLLATAAGETLRGLAAGLSARLFIDAALSAGHVISLSMGLGFGAVLDPLHGGESNAISEIMQVIALAIAVGMGVHRDAIAWLCRSVIAAPPGQPLDVVTCASLIVADGAQAVSLAIRVAYPLLIAVLSGHLAFGLLNRVTPQMGIANIGFAVAIIVGGGALYLLAPSAAALVANAAHAAIARG